MAGVESFLQDQAVAIMAQESSGNELCSYKYEFIDKIPDDLLCQICKCIDVDLSHTTCCGESFCKECIFPYHLNNRPCPNCGETDFAMILDEKDHGRIRMLELYCPMRGRGCEWKGRFEQLENHMDVQSGDCLYADVDCPSYCDLRMQKRNAQDNLSQEFPLREYALPETPLEVVPDDNWKVLPVQCPNNRCNVMCKRETLENHMKMCNKEEVVCCFNYAGCQGRFLRENEERHMEENIKTHLNLIAGTTLKLQAKVQQLEVKLLEQKVMFQDLMQVRDEELKNTIKQLERLKTKNDVHSNQVSKLKDIEDKVAELEYNTGYVWRFPITITMPFFKQLKEDNGNWYSPILHTQFCGYSYRLGVYPNGHRKGGRGTHVSVCYKAEVGNYDAQLKWPVSVTVIFQLLNQHADKNHITKKVAWTYDQEDCISNTICVLAYKVIAHEELDWNAEKETQYLKNNCLQFKIVAVKVKE